MSRLGPLDVAKLSREQRAVLDAINSGPRSKADPSIGLRGPFRPWVHAPGIGMAAQQLGAAARFGTSLAEDVKEVAICVVGVFYQAKFEYAYHAPLAIAAGVDPAAVEAIRLGRVPTLPVLPETQAVSYAVASELVRDHGLSDTTYARARTAFGEPGVIELAPRNRRLRRRFRPNRPA